MQSQFAANEIKMSMATPALEQRQQYAPRDVWTCSIGDEDFVKFIQREHFVVSCSSKLWFFVYNFSFMSLPLKLD